MYSQNIGQPYDAPVDGDHRKEKNVKEKNRSERKQTAISQMKFLVPGILPNTSKKQTYIQTQQFLEYLEKETARRNLLLGEALVAASKNDVPLPENDVEFIKAMEKKFLDFHADGQGPERPQAEPIRKPYVRRGNANRQRGPYKRNFRQFIATAASTHIQPQIPQYAYPPYPMSSSNPVQPQIPQDVHSSYPMSSSNPVQPQIPQDVHSSYPMSSSIPVQPQIPQDVHPSFPMSSSIPVQPQIPQDVPPSCPMSSSFPSGHMVPTGTNFLPYPQDMQQYEQPIQSYNHMECPMPMENFCPQDYAQPVNNCATQEYGMPVQNFQPYLY